LQVVGYYNEALKQSPEALRYLSSRGLQFRRSSTVSGLLRQPDAGYGLEERTASRRGDARTVAAAGILRETGHEHFNGS